MGTRAATSVGSLFYALAKAVAFFGVAAGGRSGLELQGKGQLVAVEAMSSCLLALASARLTMACRASRRERRRLNAVYIIGIDAGVNPWIEVDGGVSPKNAYKELKDVIRTVPEIEGLIGHEYADKLMTIKEYHGGSDVKSSLQSAFAKLMTASKEVVSEAVIKLKGRLIDASKIRTLTEKELLILSLERQYPEDVGVLALLLFNYVKLSPGEAIYIGANEPHAYLSGDCIECMATSDNVVRADLIPKYRYVDTLCDMLTYKQVSPYW